jgi:predicted lipoprotein with Yx(FWY)xxD motif
MTFRRIVKTQVARARRRLRGPVVLLVAGVAGVALAGLAGLAAAKPTTTVGAAKNSKLGETIVVNSRGLTVYELRPESTHHLLCTQAKGCFQFWLPVKVASAKTKLTAAHGVKGKLGILHRNGFFQVTLGGHPLYTFAGDASKPGMANGQGVHSFGGTWHVVAESSSAPATPSNTPTTTTPTTTTPTTPTMTTPTMTTPTMTTPYYPPY